MNSEIQDSVVNDVLGFLDSYFRSAVVTINGEEIEKPIHKTKQSGDTLRKYVYLDVEKGLVTEAALIDPLGRKAYIRKLNYQKGNKGYVIAFPVMQKVEVIPGAE